MNVSNLTLYNITELLCGSGNDMLTPISRNHLLASGGVAAWEAETALDERWLCRIPDTLRRTLNPMAQVKALEATGGELRCVLQPGAELRVTLRSPFAPCLAEVYHGGFFCDWHIIGTKPTTIRLTSPARLEQLCAIARQYALPFDPRMTRLMFPWRPAVRLVDVEGDASAPQPGMTPALRYLAYGSSITHGNQPIHPSGTYASCAARLLGADLINLGFGGGAHLEPQMADYLAGRQDWDVATLEMGINIRAVGPDEFARRVTAFVSTVAAAHPGKPVFCIDLFTCDEDFSGTGNTAAYRRVVRRFVRDCGFANVHYLSGRRLLQASDGLTVDLVHPAPHGMEEMGRRLAAAIRKHLPSVWHRL